MNELRTHLAFTQLRFYRSKRQGRTFHVTTVTDSIGEAVVEYFSGQTDVQPDSCDSFVTMENDNSRLAGECHLWRKENGVLRVGNGDMAKIKTDYSASQFFTMPIITGCFSPMTQKFAATTSAMPYRLVIFGKSLFVKNFKK